MRGSLRRCAVAAFFIGLLAAAPATSAQVVSTSTRGVNAVMQAGGYHIRPAGSAGQFGGDLAPIQTFEIVRPNDQGLTIGRIFTSCSCVRLESPKQSYEAGEPAVLHLRNIAPTPPSGQNYAIYVQITSPIRTTLRFDTFVRSSHFIPGGIGEVPTRGNISADGVMASVSDYDGEIELIVPKADTAPEDEVALGEKMDVLDNAESVVQNTPPTITDREEMADGAEKQAGPAAALDPTGTTQSGSPDRADVWADVQPRSARTMPRDKSGDREAREEQPLVSQALDEIMDMADDLADEVEEQAFADGEYEPDGYAGDVVEGGPDRFGGDDNPLEN